MNYSIISIFSLEYKSLIGGVLLILSHAFISSGLFLLIGILYIRYSTRIYFYFQHLVNFMPLFTTYFFLFILNLISIPFSSSFISEFLMLSGLLKSNFFICILLSVSLFLNTLYSIWLFNRISFGLSPTYNKSKNFVTLDLNKNIHSIQLIPTSSFNSSNTLQHHPTQRVGFFDRRR